MTPFAFAAGSVAAHLLLRRAPATIATDLGQPLPVVTNWQAFGASLWIVLALAIAVAVGGVLAALHFLRKTDVDARTALALIGASALLALIAALSWPIVFSSDVYAYAAYGDEALRGIDPSAALPLHVSDPILTAARWQWSGTFPICVYGNVFVAFARIVVSATHAFGTGFTLLAFRLAACAAFLTTCASLYFLLPSGADRNAARIAGIAAFALNPVALWTVAEGHNDALMLALAMAGAAIALRGFPALGGVATGLASLVKLPGVAIGLGIAAFYELEAGARLRHLWPAAVSGALLSIVFGVPHAIGVARAFSGHAHYAPQFSLQAIGAAVATALWPNGAAAVAGIALALLLCAALGACGLAAAMARDSSGIAWIAIAVWFAIPNPYPWYGLWVLPLAVLAPERAPLAALWAGTILVVARYLPDAYGPLSSVEQLMIALAIVAPLFYALRGLRALGVRKELAAS